MTATPTQTWKPGEAVIRWAWVSIIALAGGAWIGGICFFFNPTVSITALVIALPVFYFALSLLWIEIGRDDGIPPAIRSQLRRNLVVFGPVTVLQLLIFVFFPESDFSGLRRKPE
jgi:hypothetical protein